jgi:hypothetical protein
MAAPKKSRKPSYISCEGVAVYPWLNRPDTKFVPAGMTAEEWGGVYKTGLQVTAPVFTSAPYRDGLTYKAFLDNLIDASVEEAKREHPKEKKLVKAAFPYKEEMDDDGEETGNFLVNFKQNAKIRRKDGQVIEVKIPLFNARGEAITDAIYGGSIIKVAFTVRNTWMAKEKEAGIRLDISAVQVLKLVKSSRSASDFGFGTEGGYEDEDDDAPAGNAFAGNGGGDAGDEDDF